MVDNISMYGLDEQIKGEAMVLMDVGCEFHGYVSDMTRTWPPCGYFSPARVIPSTRVFQSCS